MWLSKIKIKHDCVIGNRCRKFNVTTMGIPFNVYVERGITHSPQVQTIHGDKKSIENFINDLKGEKRITNLEYEGDTMFFIEVRKEKIPSTYYHQKMFFVKPVYVDKKGYEYWEVASWDRKIIVEFVSNLQKEIDDVEILKIKQTKLTDIYFSHLMPKLTENQKKALLLAIENGWYAWPRRTDFNKLANLMGISIPTFREHLKRAEEKLIPELVKSIE